MSWFKKIIGSSNSPEMAPVVPGGGRNEDVMKKLSLVRRRSTSESSVGSATSRDRRRNLDDFFDRAEEDDLTDVPKHFVQHQQQHTNSLKSLPKGFFESNFDPVAHLLSELPEDVKGGDLVQLLQVKISDKDIAQDVVKENITDKILEKYETFLRGMRQIQDVDDDLRIASSHISEGTKNVKRSQLKLVREILEIPYKRRRRARLEVVMKMLKSIRGTANTERNVEMFLKKGQYPNAVRTLMSSWDALNSSLASQMKALKGLRNRFPGMVSKLRMSVDEQLQSICRHFDPIVYESIILSYSLLDRHFAKQQQNKNNKEEEEEETEETTFEVVIPEGVKPGQRFTVLFPEGRRTVECPENKRVGDKIRVGADPTSDCGALSALAQQIQTHFTQAVMRCTKSVVAGMVKDAKPGASFRELCKSIRPNDVHVTLVGIFQTLCDIMHNHYLLTQWHRDPFNPENRSSAYLHRCSPWDEEECPPRESLGFDEVEIAKLKDVSTGLVSGRKALWHHMQARLAEFLESTPIHLRTSMRFLAEIVCTTNVFVRFGETFSRESSQAVTNSLSDLTTRYVDSMHEASVRKLTIGLENDDWGRLPIDIEALGGVSAVVMKRWAPEMESVSSSPWLQRWHMRSRNDRNNALKLEQFAMLGNPFSENFAGDSAGKEAKSSLMRRLSFDNSSSSSHVSVDDSNDDHVAEKENENRHTLSEKEWQNLESVRAVTMTALNVFAKSVNQYVYAMELLPTASSTAFDRLVSLFEYYSHFVFMVFLDKNTRETFLSESDKSSENNKKWTFLQTEMRRICKNESKNKKAKIGVAAPTSMVLLDDTKTSYGLSTRVAAADSLIFLCQVFRVLKIKIMELMPRSHHQICNDFFDTQTKFVSELRALIMCSAVPRLISIPLADKVSYVRWDQSKLHTQNSKYVNEVLSKLRDLWLRLEAMRTAGSILPSEADSIWAYAFGYILEQMVNGFAKTTRKCSMEGRGLMAMDLGAFEHGIRDIHPLPRSFPPHCSTKKYAHDYVQAYYSESLDMLLQWVKSHARVYTLMQMKTLGQCCVAAQSMKSKKQIRLFAEKIEAMCRIGSNSSGD